MKKAEKFYTINVQGAPKTEAERGELNKTTGLPAGKTDKVIIEPGYTSIPNYSYVWGKQVKSKDDKPTGEIQFMEYGEPGGVELAIRYLKNTTSLDVIYQNLVNLKVRDEDTQIVLQVGINEFDVNQDAQLIKMLKNHTFNKDNKSRNPRKTVLFEEFNGNERSEKISSKISKQREAEDYVLNAEATETGLSVLADIFGLEVRAHNSTLYDALIEKAQNDAENFLNVINERKERMLEVLSFASEKGLLVSEEGGEIQLKENLAAKAKPVLPGILLEGDNLPVFLLDRFSDAEIFDLITKVTGVVSSFQQKEYL